MNPKRLIVVLGMHRSGTSLVARSLEAFGCSLGKYATWSGHDNPDFAEDQHILAIDEHLIHCADRDWHSPDMPDIHGAEMHWEGYAVLRNRLNSHPMFAIKEPRMCRLLPFWRGVFASLDCEIGVVEVVRHPMAVARSLLTRNGINVTAGMELWLDHVRRYLKDRDGMWPWVTVSYDLFLTDPVGELGRIATGLDLSLQRDATIRALDRINPNLRHHEVIGSLSMPTDVATAWDEAWERMFD